MDGPMYWIGAAVLTIGAAQPPEQQIRQQVAMLDTCMTKVAKADRFSGVIAIARRGAPLTVSAHGHPDEAGHRTMTLDTPFNIASAGKMFTAVAIGQLVEARRLRFDQPIGQLLPGLPPGIGPVTVDQLLTHRSGLGDYLRPQNRDELRSAKTATDLLPIAIADGLEFEPGAKQQYSNAGFVVLGAIIEKLSGQSYADYVRTHIFVPAGMATADLTGEEDRAVPLTKRGPGGAELKSFHIAPDIGGKRASPAGGGTASGRDMIRFGEALGTGKLLPRRILDQLWLGRVASAAKGPGSLSYGYGFARMDFPGGRWLVGHNGGSLGVNVEFELFPNEGYEIIALSNYDPPAATDAMGMARRAVLGEKPCS